MRQAGLFEAPTLNVVSKFKSSMRDALRRGNLSREQVVDKITGIIRAEGLKFPGNSKSISKPLLDKWVSDSSIHMIPMAILPVFCAVVRDWQPLQALAEPLGLEVISEEEAKLLLWAKAEMEKRKASKKARKLAEEIGI